MPNSNKKKKAKGGTVNDSSVERELEKHFQQISPICPVATVIKPLHINCDRSNPVVQNLQKRHDISTRSEIIDPKNLKSKGLHTEVITPKKLILNSEFLVKSHKDSKFSTPNDTENYVLAKPVTAAKIPKEKEKHVTNNKKSSGELRQNSMTNIISKSQHGDNGQHTKERKQVLGSEEEIDDGEKSGPIDQLSGSEFESLNEFGRESKISQESRKGIVPYDTHKQKRTIKQTKLKKSETPKGTVKKMRKASRRLSLNNKTPQRENATTPITCYLKKNHQEGRIARLISSSDSDTGTAVTNNMNKKRPSDVGERQDDVQLREMPQSDHIDIQLWHGQGKRRKVTEITDLDIILSRLTEVAAGVKDETDNKMCRKALDRFVGRMQRDIHKMIETVQTTRKLKTAASNASRNIKHKRKYLLELKKEVLQNSEEVETLKKQRFLLKKKISSKKDIDSMNSWLHYLQDDK